MMDAPTIAERIRAFVAEQTALPGDQIDMVIRACELFWRQYPAALETAARLAKAVDEA